MSMRIGTRRSLALAAATAALLGTAAVPASADEVGAQANPSRHGTTDCGTDNVMLTAKYHPTWALRVVIRRESDQSYWETEIPGNPGGIGAINRPVATPLTSGSWQVTVLSDEDGALEDVTASCV